MVDAEGRKLKVPHMGWNRVKQAKAHPLWSGIEDASRFYFVHSYFPEAGEGDLVTGTTEYGVPFTCAVARDSIFAVQFHPEKSNTAGLRLLANFLNWNP
jgi:glutamine amidotransferase